MVNILVTAIYTDNIMYTCENILLLSSTLA